MHKLKIKNPNKDKREFLILIYLFRCQIVGQVNHLTPIWDHLLDNKLLKIQKDKRIQNNSPQDQDQVEVPHLREIRILHQETEMALAKPVRV